MSKYNPKQVSVSRGNGKVDVIEVVSSEDIERAQNGVDELKSLSTIYPVDISRVGSGNNILYIEIPDVTSYDDLDGKIINLYTGVYANNSYQTVYLNINGYGERAIRRIVPDSRYYTDKYNANEVNRYTVMQLYISGSSVYWVNPTSVEKESLNSKANTADLPNIKKNSSATTGDIIDTHLTIGTRSTLQAKIGNKSVSIGSDCVAGGENSLAVGYCARATGQNSIAVGGAFSGLIAGNRATGTNTAVIGGYHNFASGATSGVFSGADNSATGVLALVLGGMGNTALAYQTKMGRYSAEGTEGTSTGTEGDALIVGIGTSSTRKNGFRVDNSGNGYFYRTVSGTGADYAEAWEWLDGNPNNEDRVGKFVAFEGTKIRLATENDPKEILGVISALPAVIGDNFADEWQGIYLKDKFGRLLTEHKSYEAEYDAEGNLIHEAYEADEYIVNPEYDPTLKYIPRLERPEYDAVGTHGKLVVIDDGTCSVGGFCMPSENGVATASENGFYVMERIDETTVKIYVR